MVFLDTCILIDYSKENIEINQDDIFKYCVNSIVQLEFMVGALNKRELKKINQLLVEFHIVDIEQDILNVATKLMNEYTLSHGMTVYDSIIAATCLVYDLPLWTHNKKNFRYITDLKLA